MEFTEVSPEAQRAIQFADETTSGESCESLRGLRRITIAAKCSSEESFEWLRRFNHDYLGDAPEIKSDLALAVIERNRAARDYLLANICNATIAVIDLAEHTRSFFRELQTVTGGRANGIRTGTAFLNSGILPKQLAQEVLRYARRDALHRTAVVRIESLLSIAAHDSHIPLGSGPELFDREAIDDLSEREFAELAGRFALALGDAVNPETQADVITQKLAGMRFCNAGHVALAYLEAAVEPDAVFDLGSSNAFDLLAQAHQKIIDAITAMRMEAGQFSPGSLRQDDSQKVLGLQAADIAAGVARRRLEQDFESTLEAARGLKRIFSRVMLNDRWEEEFE